MTISEDAVNPLHRDIFSKVSISLLTVVCIGAMTSVYGIFKAQLVFADDLETALHPIRQEIQILKEDNKHNRSLLERVAQGQAQQQILYYEDQIRILEVTSSERTLSPTETQRLLRYKADLQKLDR